MDIRISSNLSTLITGAAPAQNGVPLNLSTSPSPTSTCVARSPSSCPPVAGTCGRVI